MVCAKKTLEAVSVRRMPLATFTQQCKESGTCLYRRGINELFYSGIESSHLCIRTPVLYRVRYFLLSNPSMITSKTEWPPVIFPYFMNYLESHQRCNRGSVEDLYPLHFIKLDKERCSSQRERHQDFAVPLLVGSEFPCELTGRRENHPGPPYFQTRSVPL